MATLQYLVKAVFLAAFLASYLGWAMIDLPELATDKSLRKKYNKINDLLVKYTPWDDSHEPNMLVARGLLHKERTKRGKLFNKKSPTLIKSLQQFIALDIALEPEMLCTKEAAAILKANVLSIDEAESSTPRRKRINIIVNDAVDRYVVNCVNYYERLFSEININMDDRLDTFLMLFVQPTLYNIVRSSEYHMFDESHIVGPVHHYGFAIAAIKALAAADPNLASLEPTLNETTDEYVFEVDKLESLYNDHIVANCWKFAELTRGPLMRIEQDDFMRDRVRSSLEVRMAHDRFRLCDHLTREHDFFPSLVEYLRELNRIPELGESSHRSGPGDNQRR